jgi:hypothetical protein
MKQSQLIQQKLYVLRFNERVIMIRQYAPRERVPGLRAEQREQLAAKIIHPLRRLANVIMMLVTRGRDKKTQMAEVGPVRRRMPWIAASFAPGEQLRTLLLIELTPDIARGRHGVKFRTGPHKCGTPNFTPVQVRISAFRPFGFGSADARLQGCGTTNQGDGNAVRLLRPPCCHRISHLPWLTRQMVSSPSSLMSRLPSLATVIPAGRPQTLPSGVTKPVTKSSYSPRGLPVE